MPASTVSSSDLEALWSGFADADATTLDRYLSDAEMMVDALFAQWSLKWDADNDAYRQYDSDAEEFVTDGESWTQQEKDYLILRRAAHDATVQEPMLVRYAHEDTSAEVAFQPGKGMRGTPFGQQYLDFITAKRGSHTRIYRSN